MSKLNIMDLGTGSGCIAVSLAKFLPNAEITAVDISDKALMLARRNAQLNKARVNFLKIDLRGNWEFRANTYDIIASNPPYIPSAEINRLQPEISYEPRIALDGGRDGLDFCRGIIKQAPRYLKDAGLLIMEIGFGQRQAIENILDRSKGLCVKEIIKDYNGIDRVLLAQKR